MRTAVPFSVVLLLAGACADAGPSVTDAIDEYVCADAQPNLVGARDDVSAVISDGVGHAWIVDPDGRETPLDVSTFADPDHVVAGGDGRIWSASANGDVTAFDPADGRADRTTIDGWTEDLFGLEPSLDGVLIVGSTALVSINGSPLEMEWFTLPADGAGPDDVAVGPDGVIWAAYSANSEGPRLVALGSEGQQRTFDDGLGEAIYPRVFAGRGCALLIGGEECERIRVSSVSFSGEQRSEGSIPGGCDGSSSVYDGVAWIASQNTVTRLDLTTGETKHVDLFECGEGIAVFPGPEAVIATDNCDIAAVSLDPTTAEVIEERDLFEYIIEDGDALFDGGYPWAVTEQIVLHLPSLDPITTSAKVTPGLGHVSLLAPRP